MRKRDVLIEIGTEEIPARFIQQAGAELKDKLSHWFDEKRIDFETSIWYATPRRLVVIAYGVAEQQRELSIETRGPAKHIAVDDNGAWTKAAIGFARGQGVSPDGLFFKEYKGEPYVFARKRETGRATNELLSEDLPSLITSLSFPKNMRWGCHTLRFVRPIRWLVTLFGSEVIEVEIAGVRSGNVTRGHRFLGSDTPVEQPADYVETLKRQYVIVDPEERRALIKEQLQKLEETNGWNIPVDEHLLEEIVYLVEYPTALSGTFDSDFLSIPEDVLVTTMREHQRYFPVKSPDGHLLPHFVTVRNGDDTALETVARGNEKVIRARLADARFFYEEDRKRPLHFFNQKLEHVVFHEKLGTVADKVRRIRAVTAKLAERLHLDDDVKRQVERTAELCKFDLETHVVYEFPELQGKMGEIYARHAGEDEQVAKGIFEHYLPRHAGDALPSTVPGTLVGLVDKVDTVAACFGIGIVPTGSEDPYALRRQAAGVIQVLVSRDERLTLTELFSLVLDRLEQEKRLERSRPEIEEQLYAFFALRLKYVLQSAGIRYDIVEAVLKSGIANPQLVVRKGELLSELVKEPAFKGVAEAFTRVYHITRKQDASDARLNERLVQEPAERALYEAYREACATYEQAERRGNVRAMYEAIDGMAEAIHTFFDDVMVMVADRSVRLNRLALLDRVCALVRRFAHFNELVIS